jgi:hypothetical protein
MHPRRNCRNHDLVPRRFTKRSLRNFGSDAEQSCLSGDGLKQVVSVPRCLSSFMCPPRDPIQRSGSNAVATTRSTIIFFFRNEESLFQTPTGACSHLCVLRATRPDTMLTSLSPLRGVSHSEQYKKRFGIVIQHPKQKLIVARKHEVRKQSDFNPMDKVSRCNGARIFLVPELVEVLPIPRHLLYTLGHADRFMPGLERQISLAFNSQRRHKMASKTRFLFPLIGSQKVFDTRVPLQFAHRKRNMLEYLEEATALFPNLTYQLMEFLGDSVLGYFLMLNIFVKNPLLRWDHDNIGDWYSIAARNKALQKGALYAGINRLLHAEVPFHGVWPP